MNLMKNTMFAAANCFLLLTLFTAAGAETKATVLNQPYDLTELSPEELIKIKVATVYSASKYEQKLSEAPSSISIITASDIKKYGYRTLADILRSVRSFYVTYDRNYSYVGVRGFGRPSDYNTRILFLVDGHRLNDNIYDGALVGTEFILDVDLIDRVEVIRGPGSSLYGSNAFFAVVNVITKRGRDLKGTEMSGAAGSYKTYKGRLSYGDTFQNGMEAIISGSGYTSKGQRLYFSEFDNPDTNNGITNHTDYDRNYSPFVKLSYYDFTLESAYISRTKGIPTASFGTDFNDKRNKTTDRLGYLDLKYESDLGKHTDIMAKLFYDYYEYKGNYIYKEVVNKDWGYGTWWGGELKISKKLFEAHKIILGADYRDNMRQDQRTYDEEPYYLYLDDKRSSKIWASYLQDEFAVFKNLVFNVGVRYDHYDTFGGTTNPRLALIYNPLEKSTFKLLYGRAFRAPNVYELYYQSLTAKANTNLKPETIRTYEMVYEQYLGDSLRGTVSGFYYKIKDLISQTTDPDDSLLVFRNVEEIRAKGFELELEDKLANGIEGRLSYTFQETENRNTGKILTNSPKHLAKANLTAPLIKEKLSAGIEEQYMSRRKTLADSNASGFFITNLTLLSQRLIKNMEISGSLYNLLNKKYGAPGAEEHVQDIIKQDGRSFRLKLTYKF